MSEKILLIDGHRILNRAFYGLPDLTNSEGKHTGAVYGFLNILFRILEEEKPQYLTVAFDLHAPTFRHKMYEAYKGTRKLMPEELREQVPLIQEMLTAMGVKIVTMEGYEADDILGTLAGRSEKKGMDVTILSGDRDLLQLATEKVMIRLPRTVRGKTTIEDFHAEQVLEKYQVTPPQIVDLKALMGDSADNIPGIPGVGEKTATKIIAEYGSVENYPTWKYNLRFDLAVQNKVNNMYPTLMRPILFAERKYNMDLTHNSFLLEIGTDANTLDEATYSARLFATALAQLLKDDYIEK